MEQFPEGQHGVRFFERAAYPAEQIASFLKEGLDAGCFVMALATRPHLEAICDALSALGVSEGERVGAGQLALEDARSLAAALVQTGKVEPSVFEARLGQRLRRGLERYKKGRAYGEVVDELLRTGDVESCLALETLWSEVLKEQPVELLCGYSLDEFAGDGSCSVFRRVCDAHQHVQCDAGERLGQGRMAAELWQSRAALSHEAAERRCAERDLSHAYEDLARAYETARSACERAELASLSRDEFMARLGHELRNPLAPILVATELMARRAPDTFDAEREVIERQAQHLMHLIDDLLDVARITSGKLELRRRPVELGRVAREALEIVMPLVHQNGHQLTLEVAEAGLLVDGDQQRLTQVVVNLLSNAAKYTPAGGQIVVEATSNATSVTLAVSDDGIGLEQELSSRIFDLFVQGEQSRARAHGGLGLGLTIANSLVQLHGGRLRVFSDGPGCGSSFEMELPLSATRAAPNTGVRGKLPRAGRALDILVIDDNLDLATLFADSLRERGHRVEVALDGSAALRLAEDFRPDVALLDLGLPDIDGCELGPRLKAHFAQHELKLIAISGYGHESDFERTRAAGFDLHLVKPVPLHQLESALAELFTASCVA